jgi:hypothetical protein
MLLQMHPVAAAEANAAPRGGPCSPAGKPRPRPAIAAQIIGNAQKTGADFADTISVKQLINSQYLNFEFKIHNNIRRFPAAAPPWLPAATDWHRPCDGRVRTLPAEPAWQT